MAREPDVVHRLPRQRTAHGTIDRAAAHYCRGWCHALESRGRGRRQPPACPRRTCTTTPNVTGDVKSRRGPSHQPLGVGWGPQGGCSRNTSGLTRHGEQGGEARPPSRRGRGHAVLETVTEATRRRRKTLPLMPLLPADRRRRRKCYRQARGFYALREPVSAPGTYTWQGRYVA